MKTAVALSINLFQDNLIWLSAVLQNTATHITWFETFWWWIIEHKSIILNIFYLWKHQDTGGL